MSAFYVRTLACVAVLAAAATLHAAPNPAKTAAREDAAAERETILRTADEIQTLQATVEASRTEATALKADITKLQQESADLRILLEKAEETRVKERDALLAEVSKMIADGRKQAVAKKPAAEATPTKVAAEPVEATEPKPAESQPKPKAKTTLEKASVAEKEVAPKKPSTSKTGEKGYSHVVQKGETLTMIAEAYQEQNVRVTVAEIRKANSLTGDTLQIGQKLFIPKK